MPALALYTATNMPLSVNDDAVLSWLGTVNSEDDHITIVFNTSAQRRLK